ncbi:MAG: hypothetical protein FGM24_10085, partial [Candidatus Kapabacteria bacterium]|nr:hypothetical protein [Candidatus Kapabacteria bacterium]
MTLRNVKRGCLLVAVIFTLLQASRLPAQEKAWQIIGSLTTDRHHHEAVYIGNSRVLVIGGYTNATGVMEGIRTASCQIVDVRTKSIVDAAPLSVERGIVNAVVSSSGDVYVIGGDTDNGPSDIVERYDALRDKWVTVGRLRVARWQQASCFISPTEILVVAGFNENRAEIFDIATGQSTLIADFPFIANQLVPIEVLVHRPAFIGGRKSGPNTSLT